jgi:hypothetical protein
VLEELRNDPYHQLIDDTIEELESWDCFRAAGRSFHRERPEKNTTDKKVVMSKPVRTGQKIGRNDLCPCGSGRNTRNAVDVMSETELHCRMVPVLIIIPSAVTSVTLSIFNLSIFN